MINPLNCYSNVICSHCLSSEMNAYIKNDLVLIKKIELKSKTETLFPDFLYLLWLTKIKSKKKPFFLSDAEKKFQTRVITDSILNTQMSQKQFNVFWSYLFKYLFRDFLRQTKPKTLILLKQSFLVNIKQLPFLMYNKNFFFTILFQHTTDINVQLLIKFQTPSLPKKLLFVLFHGILALESVNWSRSQPTY